MRLKLFIIDAKRAILNQITLLVLITTTATAQIDYHAYPQTIDSKESIVKVEWLTSSPKKCPIDFNHLVNFISVEDHPATGSTVTVDLYQNTELVRSFTFPVGDHIANRIYTYRPLNLREGDHVFFIFKLNYKTKDEAYVFNIYEEPRAAIKTVAVIKPSGLRIPEKKDITAKTKIKTHTVPWVGRKLFKIQEPIGREF